MPVTSFNTRTGEVILLEDDVLAALGYVPQASIGYTPLNKAGDTMTGPLQLAGPPRPRSTRQPKPMPISSAHCPAFISSAGLQGIGIEAQIHRQHRDGYALNVDAYASHPTSSWVRGSSSRELLVQSGNGRSSTKVDAIDATKKIITLHVCGCRARYCRRNVQHDDTVALQTAINTIVDAEAAACSNSRCRRSIASMDPSRQSTQFSDAPYTRKWRHHQQLPGQPSVPLNPRGGGAAVSSLHCRTA